MAGSVDSTGSPWRLVVTPVGLMVVALAVMWGVEVIDSVALNDELHRY